MKGPCSPRANDISGMKTFLKTYIETPRNAARVCTHKLFYSGEQSSIDACKLLTDEHLCNLNSKCEFTAPLAVLHASSSCHNLAAA